MTLELRNLSLVQDGVTFVDNANLILQRRTMNALLGGTIVTLREGRITQAGATPALYHNPTLATGLGSG